MIKISRILLVVLIITSLFAGVAAASKFEVKKTSGDHIGEHVEEGHKVKITHTDGTEHIRRTDRDGRIDDINPDDLNNNDDIIEGGDDGICDENGDEDFDDNEDEECETVTPESSIPEFPTVALPIAAVIGMVFLFQKWNRKE